MQRTARSRRVHVRRIAVGCALAGLCLGLQRSSAFSAVTVHGSWTRILSSVGCGQSNSKEGSGYNRKAVSSVRRRALPEALESAKTFLDMMPMYVESYGPLGPVFYFVAFVLAECLSLPASPLMISSGFLFGLQLGCLVSLMALCTAATISFFLARTVLRPQLSQIAQENDAFQRINCAVEAEGFKIVFLLRLAPLLPFALSNYAYGLSAVGFKDFFSATVLGCAPGTCALVYFATVARSLGNGEEGSPWYVYAASIVATGALLKVVSDVAQKAILESSSQQECQLMEATDAERIDDEPSPAVIVQESPMF